MSEMQSSWKQVTRRVASGARVGVLYGGNGAEREISLLTGQAFGKALTTKGYQAELYDLPAALEGFLADPPEVVLLALHGDGEEGTIQGLLEVLGVSYTGSGVLASALCMDKERAKAVMRARGVSVAEGIVLERTVLESVENFDALLQAQRWDRSRGYVIKPTDSGSSHGVFVLDAGDDPGEALASSITTLDEGLASEIMIERRLTGPEFSVGFFGGESLGVIRITPEKKFYDFEAKYRSQTTRYEPVEDEQEAADIMALATSAWEALGGRGVGRVDVMADTDASGSVRYFVLEANTIPGMTATSLVPKLARAQGVEFEDFVELMVQSATTDRALRGK